MYQSRLAQASGPHARFRIHLGVTTKMTDDIEIDEKDIAYSKEYDAYYNQATNEWIDPKCNDRNCEYCTKRPERPVVDK
jgi:hypothetical protein